MELDVTETLVPINLAPGSLQAEVAQNVRTFLATRKGDVPLDREFGLDWSFVDMPYQVARAQLGQRIVEGLARYEPRAQVVAIQVDDNPLTGRMQPTVRIRINGSN